MLSLHQLYVQKLGKTQHGYYNGLVLSVSQLDLGIVSFLSSFSPVFIWFLSLMLQGSLKSLVILSILLIFQIETEKVD